MAFLLFQILDGTLRPKPIKFFCLLSNVWEGCDESLHFDIQRAVESMYDNSSGMVGAVFCDHGYQLSVANCFQAAFTKQ